MSQIKPHYKWSLDELVRLVAFLRAVDDFFLEILEKKIFWKFLFLEDTFVLCRAHDLFDKEIFLKNGCY